jgi:hypothetical protein
LAVKVVDEPEQIVLLLEEIVRVGATALKVAFTTPRFVVPWPE